MSAVAAVRDDVRVANGDDPHGLKARMYALGLRQQDLVERLGVAPNTITRALSTDLRSTVRPKIDALLTMLEEERASLPGSVVQLPDAARRLAQIVGDERLADVRIEYVGDGKVQRLVALLVDPDVTRDELEEKLREWRRGHDQ